MEMRQRRRRTESIVPPYLLEVRYGYSGGTQAVDLEGGGGGRNRSSVVDDREGFPPRLDAEHDLPIRAEMCALPARTCTREHRVRPFPRAASAIVVSAACVRAVACVREPQGIGSEARAAAVLSTRFGSIPTHRPLTE